MVLNRLCWCGYVIVFSVWVCDYFSNGFVVGCLGLGSGGSGMWFFFFFFFLGVILVVTKECG